jgi:cell division transport system permease protein
MLAGPREQSDHEVRSSPQPRIVSPIVPKNSIGGRALVAVIAIMTFLASLTTGAVMLVRASAGHWQDEVAREVTIQVRPRDARDIESDLRRAADLARATPGVAEVTALSREQSARLLEPWLGAGLALDDLPVPRLIVVKLAPEARPDLDRLRRTLAAEVATATLDDHRAWIERMRAMSRTSLLIGALVLLLVVAATVLSVTFATRGAIAANRAIIEVLHYIGARTSFIAGHFHLHFLSLGLKGGVIGAGAAILLFAFAQLASRWLLGGAGESGLTMLFGAFSLGVAGYAVILLQIVLIAVATALTSRYTVNRTLDTIE